VSYAINLSKEHATMDAPNETAVPEPSVETAENARAERKARSALPMIKWFLIVGGIVAVIAAFAGAGSSNDSSSSVTGDGGQEVSLTRAGAFDVCKQFVGDRLKAPSTATWRDPYGDQVSYSGDGDAPITVSASVDSENSFGASLRSTYECTVVHTNGDNWRFVNLDINDGGDLG
jgi:hypothetical protein